MRVSELTGNFAAHAGQIVSIAGYFRGHDDLPWGALYDTPKDTRSMHTEKRIIVHAPLLCRQIVTVGGRSCRVVGDKAGKSFRAFIRLTGVADGRNSEGFITLSNVTSAELLKSDRAVPLMLDEVP